MEKNKFQLKHPEGTEIDKKIVVSLQKVADGMNVSCARATEVSRQLNVSMIDVGRNLDLGGFFIVDCQLGIFGKSKKTVTPAQSVPDKLEVAISSSLENGRLSCATAWELAKQFQLPRKEIAQVCEKLNVKIKPCQLGAF
ncbi:MAG: hypothetical protein K9K75_06125 [Deltaproteobacteria bacterium]|nr:hypothetical protein [Deltaproteobacteria bacterium]